MIYAQDLRPDNIFRSAFGNPETVLSVIDNTRNGKIPVLTKEEFEKDSTKGYASEHHRDMYSHLILCKENGNQYKPFEIEGEPLTELWVGRFGGELIDEGDFHKDYKIGSAGMRLKIRYKKQNQRFLIGVWDGDQHDDDDCAIIWLEFVHQLQNAYRSIRQIDLKLK